jgi:acyl-CoA reductase-like NAD-dependent aldehyde dehydrogenase
MKMMSTDEPTTRRHWVRSATLSNDISHAQAIVGRIEAGTIWINSMELPLLQAHLSRYKESGLGGE